MIIAVIGGGAAGFFAAIHASGPGIRVLLFEKSPKLLSKVKISGGGRCNVTHRPMEISKLVKNYPRGEKFLKKAFAHFSIPDTFSWFESRGVPLKVEEDGRVFPKSNTSQTIVTCLEEEAKKLGVQIIEVPYICLPRKFGVSKTGVTLFQLIKRGMPYATLPIRIRISNRWAKANTIFSK